MPSLWYIGLGVVIGTAWSVWPGPAFAATAGLAILLGALYEQRRQRR